MRNSLAEDDEARICAEHFDRYSCRSQVPSKSLVIGRYSVLPYYEELEEDLDNYGSRLINSYEQHKWIADFSYYNVLKNYTFESWTDDDFWLCKHPGPFVVKGKTNSRKFDWNTMMYAETKKDALIIAAALMKDPMIGPQGVVYRKYVPLLKLDEGLNGLPFTFEYRYFFLGCSPLVDGYYWSNANFNSVSFCNYFDKAFDNYATKIAEFALSVAAIVQDYVNFFVLDVAITEDGNPILVEINDGQMSGLSMCSANTLYRNLQTCIKNLLESKQDQLE